MSMPKVRASRAIASEHARDRRDSVIGEIHRDLRLAAHAQTQRLDMRHAAGRGADAAGDMPGDRDIVTCQENVKCDQQVARADDAAASLAQPARAEVRHGRRAGRERALQPFIAAAPDIGEIRDLPSAAPLARRERPAAAAHRRRAPPTPRAMRMQSSMLRAAQGHEGYDISRANSWMLTKMLLPCRSNPPRGKCRRRQPRRQLPARQRRSRPRGCGHMSLS